MSESAKLRILLADEDALRRDGLSAVLNASGRFELLTGAPDGETALDEIRAQGPDVAIVNLNLPKLHGIELVRRVRSEAPATKVIIVAGTTDDEIIREVIRAGADGYLLKNGPAKHLIDAIDYVNDGGQYFSPQLRRDGRDRHLLQEPPRPVEPAARVDASDERLSDESDARRERTPRTARNRRSRRTSQPMSDPAQFRERIRQEVATDLNDHDYEVMSRMADGIRPILDRLDEIDARVAQMETGDEPVPSDPRGWLRTQLADTVRDHPGSSEVAVLGRSVNDLEARLPDLIENAVTRRFHQMADKLQQEIEETHVRTLETFVRNIQSRLVQRVSALEQDMGKQAEAMNQLREYSQRTEDNLSRLISGVDKLAQELPRRLAAAGAQFPQAEHQSGEAPPQRIVEENDGVSAPRVSFRRKKHTKVKLFWAGAAGLILLLGLGWAGMHLSSRAPSAGEVTADSGAPAQKEEKPKTPPASADTKTKMQAAQECVDRKDYAIAEDLYKQVVKAEPNNADALKALASVLYREEKIDESAAVLDRLTKN
jgi:two-component system nitrate/nitrite response regulator NarL